jgi:hypothetical protein
MLMLGVNELTISELNLELRMPCCALEYIRKITSTLAALKRFADIY